MNTDYSIIKKKGFKDYFNTYKKTIIILSFISVLIGGILLWFDNTQKNKRLKVSENFIEAKILLAQEENLKSLDYLKSIILQKDKVYSPLSLFLIIDNNLEKNKEIIIQYFDELLSINALEDEDINLLKLKKAIYISNSAKEQNMLDLLNPIINSNSVWKFQSLKFLGDYYFSLKQFKKAEQYYRILLETEDNNIDKNEIERKVKIINNG
tara:strand:+ start:3316 stop:3945 length:630 start_codon:yes stop_codon:yes gene_type:complete